MVIRVVRCGVWCMVIRVVRFKLFVLVFQMRGLGLLVEGSGFRGGSLGACFGDSRAQVRGLRSGIALRMKNNRSAVKESIGYMSRSRVWC
jgi:hypothetical protein